MHYNRQLLHQGIFQQCKQNADIPQSIPSDKKKKIKLIALEVRLYLQVVMNQRSIAKDNDKDHISSEDNSNKNSEDTPNVN